MGVRIKLAIVVTLFVVTLITGCGGVASKVQSNMKSQTITVDPNVTVSLQVPKGWTKKKIDGGDTVGILWVNPKNSNEWVRLLYSGNAGALLNNSGVYDVTSYINTQGVIWNSVSNDHLSGEFTVPVGAINNASEGYGYAKVISSPNSLGVNVEAVMPQDLAQIILEKIRVQNR